MRKIHLLLLVVAFIAIGCSGDSPTGPSMGMKGIYTIHGYGVLYDKQNQTWEEENKEHILIRRYDGDISFRRANYYNCFGNNWRKGISNDYSGALLESLFTIVTTIYKYDSNNFLIERTRYRDGEVEDKSEYQNENGKIKTEIYTSATSTSVKSYEYGKNGYIKREYLGKPNDQSTSFFEYHHDNNGYVTEKWYYSHQSDPDPSKTLYIYNNLRLLIRIERENGEVITEYKYNNSLGICSEMIDGKNKHEYKYNLKGMLIENISYIDGKPWSKMRIEYID